MIGSSIISGQILSRTGRYKMVAVFGMLVMTVGMFLLSGMGADTDYLTVVRNMVVVGIGIGPTMPVFTLAAQNAVKMNQLGVVTSLTQFARSIGSTLGVAVFGSLLTNQFAPAFRSAISPDVAAVVPPAQLAQLQNPQVLLNPQLAAAMQQQFVALGPQGADIFNALLGAIKIGLVVSLHDVFLLGAVLSAIGLVTVLFLKELPLRKTFGPPQLADHASATAAQVGEGVVSSLPTFRPQDGRDRVLNARKV
jgi:MFS family permease